ncbi:unnamed protein product [Peniophora sp. CBMAI 1063]|nr:unnamed protein product [Peniophora sp. CBMAI 1063]
MLGLALLAFSATALALNNGVGRTPAMGWNPYNAYGCSTTEAEYHTNAQLMKSLGLVDLGYTYFGLDTGWQGTKRASNGSITWSTTTLPSGVPSLAGYVHGLGMKFGVYSDSGYFACDCNNGNAGYIGSLGFETQDANAFASWGADYLKYDNCFAVSKTDFVDYNPSFSLTTHFATMRDALASTGVDIAYSLCEWGLQDPARWPGTVYGNSWRMSNDIADSWNDVVRIINELVPIAGLAAPGGFNDMDLLEVGNSGMTSDEQTAHFTFWAAAKSPLFISTDLSSISSTALALLKNKNIIALNQDSLGKSITFKRRYTSVSDVWSGPLSDGSTAVVVLNWKKAQSSLTLDLADVGFSSASATNLLTGTSLGTLSNTYTATVSAHGVLALKLSNTKAASARTFTYYNAASSSSTLTGTAATRAVNSSVSVVGFIGQNAGTLTINGIDGGSGGSKLVSVDYINADWTMTNTACPNCRVAYLSVNGGTPVAVEMPLSGMTWDLVFQGYLVELSGFKTGKSNTITISNPTSAYAPDMYRVGVQV